MPLARLMRLSVLKGGLGLARVVGLSVTWCSAVAFFLAFAPVAHAEKYRGEMASTTDQEWTLANEQTYPATLQLSFYANLCL